MNRGNMQQVGSVVLAAVVLILTAGLAAMVITDYSVDREQLTSTDNHASTIPPISASIEGVIPGLENGVLANISAEGEDGDVTSTYIGMALGL